MNSRKLIYPLLIVTSITVLLQGNVAEASASSIGVAYPDSNSVQPEIPSGNDVAVVPSVSSPIVDAGLIAPDITTSTEVSVPSDPYFDQQWALEHIRQPELWPVTQGDSQILVAVLDTGIDKDHEDLVGQVTAEINFTESDTSDDIYGHGTPIAGIIAAVSDNGTGIAGMAPESRLLNIKVVEDYGRCRPSAVAKGIIWAVDNGANVINISVQLSETSTELKKAVDYAWNNGALVIAAAGNNGNQEPVYPAGLEQCVAVAATDADDGLALLSNYGDWVDVAAPGYQIYSTLPGSNYGYKSGTSFATAYVSGLAALLFDLVIDVNENGQLNDEVRMALELGCEHIDLKGIGSGRIDAGSIISG